MHNIEQAIRLPKEVAKAVKKHQLMIGGNLARIDPVNETTKNCSTGFSLRALVREALAHGNALEAIGGEWELKEVANF